jgi:hypothetical protein
MAMSVPLFSDARHFRALLMLKRSLLLITALFGLVALVGCSGSSSGGVTVSPEFAGIYEGMLNVSVQSTVGSASEVSAFRLIVGVDGNVQGLSPGFSSSSQCSGEDKQRAGDNAIFITGTYTCYDPRLGVCTVPAEFTVAFNSGAASISGSATYNCQVAKATAQFAGYMPKVS